MTVKELKEILNANDLSDDLLVVISIDSEGNGYNTLRNYDTDMVFNQEEREIGFSKLTEELIKDGYGEEDIMEDGKPCIVLWP